MRAGLATETRGLSTSPLRRAEEGETVLTVVESLADLGYFVLPAQNAAEALTCLRSNEKIDILFSDVNVRRSGQPLDC
jgi:hypothetical protein